MDSPTGGAASRSTPLAVDGADTLFDPGVFDVGPENAAELHLLTKALTRLSPRKREAFVLMAIFGLSAREAAEVLGTFANTAASRYRHAKHELEKAYRDVENL